MVSEKWKQNLTASGKIVKLFLELPRTTSFSTKEITLPLDRIVRIFTESQQFPSEFVGKCL
jgi:hypothetical protein